MRMSTKHIPYRDSKLTRLLQPSLSGNAQICIVCNVSPLVRNLDESHNTLKFATRAKRIKQSAVINEVVDDRTLLQNYREEIDALRCQLREAREAQVSLRREKEQAQLEAGTVHHERLPGRGRRRHCNPRCRHPEPREAHPQEDAPRRRTPQAMGIGGGLPRTRDRKMAILPSRGDSSGPSCQVSTTKRVTGGSASRDLNKTAFVAKTPTGDGEEGGMLHELHRIQGLLGSVLTRVGFHAIDCRQALARTVHPWVRVQARNSA